MVSHVLDCNTSIGCVHGRGRSSGRPAADRVTGAAGCARFFDVVRIEGPDYRHRDLPPAPRPPTDDEVATYAAWVTGATLDEFDELCAHLATMHPSRYLALIDGVDA
jgi:hypothetical protein